MIECASIYMYRSIARSPKRTLRAGNAKSLDATHNEKHCVEIMSRVMRDQRFL